MAIIEVYLYTPEYEKQSLTTLLRNLEEFSFPWTHLGLFSFSSLIFFFPEFKRKNLRLRHNCVEAFNSGFQITCQPNMSLYSWSVKLTTRQYFTTNPKTIHYNKSLYYQNYFEPTNFAKNRTTGKCFFFLFFFLMRVYLVEKT